MATHDYSLANQDGASFRSDLNNALAAIVSNNSSSTSPDTTFAHQIWVDTTANVIKQRNAANDAWIELWRIDGGFNAKTFSSNVTLNAQSDLRFADSDSSNWVAFQAPATVASNVTWTLPSADGTADQALTTNGSGVLSWADAGGVQDNITEGNTSAEVVDTGSDGHFKVVTEGTEALRVTAAQRVGINTTLPGNNLEVRCDATDEGVLIKTTGTTRSALQFDSNPTTANQQLGTTQWKWNGSSIAAITGLADSDTTNKDDGYLTFATKASGLSIAERMRLTSTGSLRFGQNTTDTPSQSATAGIALNPQGQINAWRDGGSAGVFGRAQDGVVIQWYRGGSQVGTVTVASGSTAYNTTSDYRLKENVVPLTGAVDRVNQLQVRRFNFIADPDTTVDGFIAHEAQAVVPEAVTGTQDEVEVWKEGEELPDGVSVGDNKLDEDGNTIPVYQGIDQSKLVPLLTAALQEALAKIETLETRLTALEGGA